MPTSDVYAQRFQLPTAPFGEIRDFAVISINHDARGTTYTLAEVDTLRVVDTLDTKEK